MDEVKFAEAKAMEEAGISRPAIAHELGVSTQTIRNWFRSQGHDKPSATTPEEIQIVEAYEAGELTAKILAMFDIDRGRLYYLLSKHSVETRKVQREEGRKRALDEACSLYKQGYVIRQIVEDTGIHQPTLHAELARRGIPLRRPREKT